MSWLENYLRKHNVIFFSVVLLISLTVSENKNMNPCLMEWERSTVGVTFEGDSIIIPYPPPRDPNYPLSEEVLLSKPFMLPKKISFEIEVEKEQLSVGLPKEKWFEFAIFLANDVETWLGEEVGFRFPLNTKPNEFTCYVQRPMIFWNNVTDYKIEMPSNLNQKVGYSITFINRFWNFYQIDFEVNMMGCLPRKQTSYMWISNRMFSLTVVSHNWSTELQAQHLYLKLHDVTIEE